MKYRISGMMKIGRENRKFEKEVEAGTENFALQKAYMLLGAANGLPRSKIKVEKVEKVA
ncbi:MAG TPA: 50S ribosomal protein L18Ae [Candidatus Bilamarchaeaceae archaeon]|nr:50S ribosomal protein L18Ae [Candidatus Bilamarchaeaceae archaeon]